jgi:hypothetical protein
MSGEWVMQSGRETLRRVAWEVEMDVEKNWYLFALRDDISEIFPFALMTA